MASIRPLRRAAKLLAMSLDGYPAPGDREPLVSVIMPMRNTADLVGFSARSVMEQSMPSWELIVVDDNSVDDSFEVVSRLAERDVRITLLRNDGASGAGPTRNVGIQHARGRYIAFLDSDDLWLPTKLAKQLALFEETGAALTYTAYYKIGATDHVEAATFEPSRRLVRPPLRLDYRVMLRQDYIGFLTAMYDTAALGKRFLPPLRRRQDYALLLSILREGATARGLAEPLALYRAGRPGSLSANKLRAARYNWQLYREVEQLSIPRSALAFGNYAVRATRKYLI